ncbi:hypothetical protein BDA99DRAFT_566360 [Phascolomyces articulosus]|uniref:Uncharacterized protein n=1 Tax=Phascolomyces articulosus TaxID=60185 RepID=A0AAD5P730_9FUNG|nr:hypothetical protein BDA99DRAFT_566360 [Phascolomyces articulosus]
MSSFIDNAIRFLQEHTATQQTSSYVDDCHVPISKNGLKNKKNNMLKQKWVSSLWVSVKVKIHSDSKAPDVVTIEYHRGHQGHQPNSIEYLCSAPVSRETKAMIEQLVKKDLTRSNIKSMIRLDKTRLGQILSGDFNNVPHSLRDVYQEVSYPMTKVFKKRAFLSPVFDTSLYRWGAKIEQENGY